MLVDSNILIYAINEDSSKHTLAKKFLKENKGNLSLAHQNIFEAIRVLTHPKSRKPLTVRLAVVAVSNIAEALKIIQPDHRTKIIALEFVKEFGLAGNRVFDAYLAATALSNDIDTVATDNVKDFKKFPIRIINPFS